MRRINTVEELRESLESGHREFRLRLNGGLFSRKTIFPCDDSGFFVWNGVDGSTSKLTGDELYTDSNIGEGMRLGAFFEEDR